MLSGIGRLGAGICTMRSQRRQDFLGRAIWTTFNCAAIRSCISLTSSPFSVRQAWIAASVNTGCRPHLPVGAASHCVSG